MRAIESAVRFYEEPPTTGMTVAAGDAGIRLTADDWAEAFRAPGPGTPHNEARDEIWAELLEILLAKYDGDEPDDLVRRSLLRDRELRAALHRAWPLLEAADVVADLWSVPAYLLHSDPLLDARRGGVLFVGPHEPYLAYVADVLPSLGEEGVRTCTLRDLLPEGAGAVAETDPEVARLKSSALSRMSDQGVVTVIPAVGGSS